MTADHTWRGSGRFRVARIGDVFLVRFGALTSNRGRLKSDMGAFFRKTYRNYRADYRPYFVSIWLEGVGTRRLDADNVAKACLDALTGVLWRDDKQVVRLLVEKVPADTPAVVLAAEPCKTPERPSRLNALLLQAEKGA